VGCSRTSVKRSLYCTTLFAISHSRSRRIMLWHRHGTTNIRNGPSVCSLRKINQRIDVRCTGGFLFRGGRHYSERTRGTRRLPDMRSRIPGRSHESANVLHASVRTDNPECYIRFSGCLSFQRLPATAFRVCRPRPADRTPSTACVPFRGEGTTRFPEPCGFLSPPAGPRCLVTIRRPSHDHRVAVEVGASSTLRGRQRGPPFPWYRLGTFELTTLASQHGVEFYSSSPAD